MQSFDVIIVGGGIVGLALACGLQESGLRIAVIEQKSVVEDKAAIMQQHDAVVPSARVSALNSASQQLLQYIGVWQSRLAMRATPYEKMHVWDRDSFGKITFQAAHYGFNCLGYIIENSFLRQALWCHASLLTGVTLLASANIK